MTGCCSGRAVPGRPGDAHCALGSVIDINDLKQAEENLRESRERFRGTLETGRRYRPHGKPGPLPACQREAGRDPRVPQLESFGKTLEEVVHPDDLEPNLLLFDRLVRGELPSFSIEKRFVRRHERLSGRK